MSQALTPPPAAPAAPMDDPMADAAPEDVGETVVCTICSNGDGSYTVYAGDEPDGGMDVGAGGGVADIGADAGGMGGMGAVGAPEPEGTSAGSVGEALKVAMDILQDDASSEGAPGTAKDQFTAGFSSDKAPTMASASPGRRF